MSYGEEPAVYFRDPMPHGYCFVKKGNVYMTANCRKATRLAGQTVYRVVSGGPGAKASSKLSKPKKITLGLRCPQAIYEQVLVAECASRNARADAVRKRDDAFADKFRAGLLAQFPAVPPDSVPDIVRHALAKHQHRVGRTSRLELDQRVVLAVRAHIRHVHTDYDKLLREGQLPRGQARILVHPVIDATVRLWGGSEGRQAAAKGDRSGRGSSRHGSTNTTTQKHDSTQCRVLQNKENKGPVRVTKRRKTAARTCKATTSRIERQIASFADDSDSEWTP